MWLHCLDGGWEPWKAWWADCISRAGITVFSVWILETMKSWDDLFIQDYKYGNKGYSSTSFPSHLRHWLDLGMNLGQIDCRHVALLICNMMLFSEKVLQLLPWLLWCSILTRRFGLHLLPWFFFHIHKLSASLLAIIRLLLYEIPNFLCVFKH